MKDDSGILLLKKPSGISSNKALQKIKKIFNIKKAGHCGTLDPLADGLLIICIGESTKYISYLINSNKSYIAQLELGKQTSTGDLEGKIININNNKINKNDFIKSTADFLGSIEQIPHKYSAIKINGERAYKYARMGLDFTLKHRKVNIFELKVLDFCYPLAKIYVNCSKGTYIRTLVEDIAKKLNNFAYITNLHRNKIGFFDVKNSYSLEYLKKLKKNDLNKILLPTESILSQFPKLTLDDDQIIKLMQGKIVQLLEKYEIITPLCIFNKIGKFIGLVEPNIKYNYYKVLRLMSTNLN